jgi:hypothetical protein
MIDRFDVRAMMDYLPPEPEVHSAAASASFKK